ncbi:50S ribosomal protein L5 [Candidatus Pacearchaeota archaeon]|nr:50S ribosomal protein L5 [Candidatus Pacearchaeota archaeon]
MKAKTEMKEQTPHGMKEAFIEKIVLSVGGTEDSLKRGVRLLQVISAMKPQILVSQKRIPDFDVSPGLEVGARVTIRGKEAIDLLRRLLGAVDNQIKKKQISENHFSFGISEYIEIPGMEYHRDIGIRGMNITVVFARPGLRVKRKKIKQGTIPKRQHISQEEIIKFMEAHFKTEFT